MVRKNIMSANDVMRTTLKGLQMSEEWADFLGEPERNFHIVITAKPGHGKSTFCLKFANYLAQNFGKTLYVTNEENSARLKKKFQLLNEKLSQNFDVNFADEESDHPLEDIIKLLNNKKYDFLFIDSLQNGGLDRKDVKKIKKMFPSMGIVVINQSTKKGEVAGSQKQIHDGDVTIIFKSQGVAVTTKNRFGEVGKEFLLF